MGSILKIEQLSVGYGEKVILGNINIEVKEPELIVIMGLNGSGKTTLMKTICGNIEPQKGKVYLNEQIVNDLAPKEIAKTIGVVYTHMEGANDLTVYDFVALGRNPYLNWLGTLCSEDETIIQQAIDKVGLSGMESRIIGSLSDGEKKRSNIARVLAQNTPVIFLDEPSSHLDIKGKKDLYHLLKELSKEKLIFIISHNWALSQAYADTLWLVEKGKLLIYNKDQINDNVLHAHFS